MKKTSLYLLVLLVAFAASCKKNDDDKSSNLNIVELRSAGNPISNPNINPSNLKPEGAEATLRSLRYVSPLPIYYMDYTAKIDWNQLIKDKDHRYEMFDVWTPHNDLDNLLFNNPPIRDVTLSHGLCSGFVCFNPQNELLFGRNYDGDTGPLLIVFNQDVKPGEHKSVMMTELSIAQFFSGLMEEYNYDPCLLEDGKNLEVLLRQPAAVMDGMNDVGLCLAAYQLPNFDDGTPEIGHNETPRPHGVDQNTGKNQIISSVLHRMILTKCATVQDVVNFFNSYDYTSMISALNIHWYVADANNDWRTLEFWEGSQGQDSLYVMDEQYRYGATFLSGSIVPYEYRCLENFYCNQEASATYNLDCWQYGFSTKARAMNMMSHYSPTMTEEEALQCLQYGSFGVETPNQVTDWSCVYNPKKKTVIFTMRNDMSTVYSIDLNKDL